jgi:sigma-E factor negative regulatory protein RseA
MNDKVNEQLSAMVDDELPGSEQEFLLRRLQQDDELQQTWSRYHLIGEAMRQHISSTSKHDLAEKVSAAIGREPEQPARLETEINKAQHRRFFRPVAGLAVAASVAMMAIVGLQNLSGTSETVNGLPKLAKTSNSDLKRVQGTRWDLSGQQVESKLNGYLVNHNEYANSTNLQGMLHYARIAGYDSARK